MRRILQIGGVLLAAALVAGWWLTTPQTLSASDLPEYTSDPVAGERVFWAGGCASCHATPVNGKRAKGDDKLLLGGGLELDTAYGVFRVPNISPHSVSGIGDWSMIDFVNAMQRGVSPQGRHYYPSFPYTSYAKMSVEDVMDLRSYLDTLPPVDNRVDGHTLGFPWSVRRGIGLWKRRYLDDDPVIEVDPSDPVVMRGRELVEGAGHCAECHTSRDGFGGILVVNGSQARQTPRVAVEYRTSRRAARTLRTGPRATSATISRAALRPNSTPSVAPWLLCRRIWLCCPPLIVPLLRLT